MAEKLEQAESQISGSGRFGRWAGSRSISCMYGVQCLETYFNELHRAHVKLLLQRVQEEYWKRLCCEPSMSFCVYRFMPGAGGSSDKSKKIGSGEEVGAFHTHNQGRERAFEVVAFVDVVLEDVVFVDVGFEDGGFVDVAFEDVDRGVGLEKGGSPWNEKSRQGMGQACDG